MKINIRQLKQLIKEQVEEVWMPPPMIKKYVPEEERPNKNYRESSKPDDDFVPEDDPTERKKANEQYAKEMKLKQAVGLELWAVINIYAHAPNLIGVFTSEEAANDAAANTGGNKTAVVPVKVSR